MTQADRVRSTPPTNTSKISSVNYRDLDGYLDEAALAAGVCKVAIENEMMDRKENLKLVQGRRLSLSDGEISFLLRELEHRIDLLREEFYGIEPEHYPKGTPDM